MNSSSSRFASFEFLRIIVPGTYVICIVFTFLTVFGIYSLQFKFSDLSVLIFFVGSILAGLTFYAKETPKKRKAFQTNQPSIFILERSRELTATKPLSEDEARRLYFYLLNHEMPITVHDKIFFFGMIYSIMINIRRTSFWFGLVGILALIIQVVSQSAFSQQAFASVVIIWVIYAVNVRYNKADRKMQENYQDQIFWLEMNIKKVDELIIQRTTSETK